MKQKYTAYSCSQNGQPPAETYHVTVGKKAMGWVIVCDGSTAGYSCDSRLMERLNRLERLNDLLVKFDAEYLFSKLHDEGYLECSDDDWTLLKTTLRELNEES